MTAYRNTYIPPRPTHWPFAAATLTALLITMGAVLFNAPGLMVAAWLPVMWFTGQAVRCLIWAREHGEKVTR